jgi:hypothetical protein
MGTSNSTPTEPACMGEGCSAVAETIYDTDALQKTVDDMAEQVNTWHRHETKTINEDWNAKTDESLVAFGKATNLQHTGSPSVADDGCCGRANPIVPADVAPIVMVFDILCPGMGTMIAAYYDPNGCNCSTVTCAIF